MFIALFLAVHIVCLCQAAWNPERPLRNCDKYWTWGDDDQRGANNYQGPDKVLEAARLIQTGKVYSLTHTYNLDNPAFSGRSYHLTIPNSPIDVRGTNNGAWNDDQLDTQIGQVGTQFDALSHFMTGQEDSNGRMDFIYYNGFTQDEVVGAFGMKKLGIEHYKPYFTRGILMDFARHRNVDYLQAEEEPIRKTEFLDVLREQGLTRSSITEGSLVIIHTGYGKTRLTDTPRYETTWPGVDLEIVEWLADRGVSVLGSDAFTACIFPNPDYPDTFEPDHALLLVCAGMGVLEQMNTQALADDQVYEFAWSHSTLPFEGATGSPGAGMAII